MCNIALKLAILLFLTESCMCTPAADTLYVEGLNMQAPDLVSASDSVWFIHVSTSERIIEGKNQACLTYNKELAVNPTQNAVVEGSFRLICNRNLGTDTTGKQLLTQKIHVDGGRVLKQHIQVSTRGMLSDSAYRFTLSCKTANGETLSNSCLVRLKP